MRNKARGQNKGKAPMSNPTPNEAAVLTESTCKAVATEYIDKILARQDKLGLAKDWGMQNHHTLVFAILVELGLPEDVEKDFLAYAQACPGLFSNASQLRQSKLIVDKIAPSRKKKVLTLLQGLE